MKKILTILPLLLSCTNQSNPIKVYRQEVMETDMAMSKLATEVGFSKALLAFADDSVIKPIEGKLPIIGKKALAEAWSGADGTKQLSWYPLKADASPSGDFGFTFGNWQLKTNDTILYGNYCTIWKKQTNGVWKFIYDGGNNTPKPKE